jgi:DNA-binding transcriptional ArsR family regulator
MVRFRTFEALADPQRRLIVEVLREGDKSVGDIVACLPIQQSGVSRHLRILKEAGLVGSEADGQRRVYRLRPEPFEALAIWLLDYRRLWEARLENFEAELTRSKGSRDKETTRSRRRSPRRRT